MKNKNIDFNSNATEKLKKGVKTLSDAVKVTLGPRGRNVIIERDGKPISTKDGVTVAKSVKLKDKVQNMGVEAIKEAASQTADAAGDGTTTSTVLAYEFYKKGLKSIANGSSPIELKRGMDKTVAQIVKNLKGFSKDVKGNEEIKQVATISANNDSEIGKIIAAAMEEVGKEGVITVEESKTANTALEIVEGMQFDRGYLSPYFINDNAQMHTQFKDAYVFMTDKKIGSVKDLIKTLEFVIAKQKPLLIIAEDIEGEALATLIVNKARGTCQVCAIKAPGFGNTKKEFLEDIAVLTGGQVFAIDKGIKLEKVTDVSPYLGTCRSITVNNKSTVLIDGGGDIEAIKEKAEEIKKCIDNATSDYEIEKYQDRLAKLAGGVAIILIGAESEVEMKEKKDRVDDALNATRAAVAEGVIPGGGIALIKASQSLNGIEFENDEQKEGSKIILEACQEPFNCIINNTGLNSEVILNQISDASNEGSSENYGYDARNEKVVDMFEAGIIDPTKVARIALEKAASVAGTLLITECVITEEEEEKPEVVAGPGQLNF
jgi:chaperonin GroEL